MTRSDYVEPTYFSRFLGPLLPVLKETPFSPVPQPICPPSIPTSLLFCLYFLRVLLCFPSWPHCLLPFLLLCSHLFRILLLGPTSLPLSHSSIPTFSQFLSSLRSYPSPLFP